MNTEGEEQAAKRTQAFWLRRSWVPVLPLARQTGMTD